MYDEIMKIRKIIESLITSLKKYLWREVMLVLVLIFSFGLGMTISCSHYILTQKNNTKIYWDKKKFTVATIPTDKKKAIWDLSKEGNLDSPVVEDLPLDKADSVIEVFRRSSREKQASGIFIYSKSFAIPNTPEERQFMGKHLWERYNDAEWRKSESNLINELKLLCDSQGIDLYVNLSANLQGEWIKLAPSEK